MGSTFARTGLVLIGVLAEITAAGCGGGGEREPAAVVGTGSLSGLSLRAELSATDRSLVVETRVVNGRDIPVYVHTDRCNHITEAVVDRTRFAAAGRTWSGSLGAVKRSIVSQQGWRELPNRFAPRIPGSPSSDVPVCGSPDGSRKLAPGETVNERWEVDFDDSSGLVTLGSAATNVRVELVEAHGPDYETFLDGYPTRVTDKFYTGRNVRLEFPVSKVVDLAPTRPLPAVTPAVVFDRLVHDRELREWIEAQPADSWRSIQMSSGFGTTSPDSPVRLTLVATPYERAAVVTANADGSEVSVTLPSSVDSAPAYVRRAGTLPPGLKTIYEPKGFDLGQDILAGTLSLPSGRLTVDEYFFDDEPFPVRFRPGTYPVFVTLAHWHGDDDNRVALATLVLSRRPTVRWKATGGVGVDGGDAAFTSTEGAAFLHRLFETDEAASDRLFERISAAQAANDYVVTNVDLGAGLNLVQFGTGLGDGGYPIYVGYDAAGRPTRVVVDCGLLHLTWPK